VALCLKEGKEQNCKFALPKYPAIIKTLFFPEICLQTVLAKVIAENGQWKMKQSKKYSLAFLHYCTDRSPSRHHFPNQFRISQDTHVCFDGKIMKPKSKGEASKQLLLVKAGEENQN